MSVTVNIATDSQSASVPHCLVVYVLLCTVTVNITTESQRVSVTLTCCVQSLSTLTQTAKSSMSHTLVVCSSVTLTCCVQSLSTLQQTAKSSVSLCLVVWCHCQHYHRQPNLQDHSALWCAVTVIITTDSQKLIVTFSCSVLSLATLPQTVKASISFCLAVCCHCRHYRRQPNPQCHIVL